MIEKALREHQPFAHQTIFYPASLERDEKVEDSFFGLRHTASFPDEWIPDEIEVVDAPCFPYEAGSGEHYAYVNTHRLATRRQENIDVPAHKTDQFEDIIRGCMKDILEEAKLRKAKKVLLYSMHETRAYDFMISMARVVFVKG